MSAYLDRLNRGIEKLRAMRVGESFEAKAKDAIYYYSLARSLNLPVTIRKTLSAPGNKWVNRVDVWPTRGGSRVDRLKAKHPWMRTSREIA